MAADGSKNKGGRPTKRNEITEARIFSVLGTGLSYKLAAEAASICEDTLHRWRREDPDFDAECRAKSANAKAGIAALLVKKALEGNVTAMIFFLKTRTEEFREHRDVRAPDETADDRAKAIRETLRKARGATLSGPENAAGKV